MLSFLNVPVINFHFYYRNVSHCVNYDLGQLDRTYTIKIHIIIVSLIPHAIKLSRIHFSSLGLGLNPVMTNHLRRSQSVKV